MSNYKVQIYILSRDRPHYFRQALESALIQKYDSIEVVVSDNSEGDAIQEMMQSDYPLIRYIRRRPSLLALDHFRTVINESSSEMVVFFHDDDVLDPGYVSALLNAMERHPEAGAVCCNAWGIRQDEHTKNKFMGFFRKELRLNTVEEFLKPYMTFTSLRPPPFPGYMYRRKYLNGLYLNSAQGGKYSDVSFLMNVVARAPIVWLPEAHMHYRVHDSNDSVVEAVGQKLSLLRYIYTHSLIQRRSQMAAEFRFRYWMRWWRGSRHDATTWRDRVVHRYLITTGLKLALSRPGFWLRLLAKV
jgi:glycosyltransferase involved in cell wall biosynthesis